MCPGGGGFKGGRYVGLTTLPLVCADFVEIWEPQTPGALRDFADLYRDRFTFTCCCLIRQHENDKKWERHHLGGGTKITDFKVSTEWLLVLLVKLSCRRGRAFGK